MKTTLVLDGIPLSEAAAIIARLSPEIRDEAAPQIAFAKYRAPETRLVCDTCKRPPSRYAINSAAGDQCLHFTSPESLYCCPGHLVALAPHPDDVCAEQVEVAVARDSNAIIEAALTRVRNEDKAKGGEPNTAGDEAKVCAYCKGEIIRSQNSVTGWSHKSIGDSLHCLTPPFPAEPAADFDYAADRVRLQQEVAELKESVDGHSREAEHWHKELNDAKVSHRDFLNSLLSIFSQVICTPEEGYRANTGLALHDARDVVKSQKINVKRVAGLEAELSMTKTQLETERRNSENLRRELDGAQKYIADTGGYVRQLRDALAMVFNRHRITDGHSVLVTLYPCDIPRIEAALNAASPWEKADSAEVAAVPESAATGQEPAKAAELWRCPECGQETKSREASAQPHLLASHGDPHCHGNFERVTEPPEIVTCPKCSRPFHSDYLATVDGAHFDKPGGAFCDGLADTGEAGQS